MENWIFPLLFIAVALNIAVFLDLDIITAGVASYFVIWVAFRPNLRISEFLASPTIVPWTLIVSGIAVIPPIISLVTKYRSRKKASPSDDDQAMA